MEQIPPGPDGTREWLLSLERRVSELERERVVARRRSRRTLWYLAVVGILYSLVFYSLYSLSDV